jgi:hypothetical protein
MGLDGKQEQKKKEPALNLNYKGIYFGDEVEKYIDPKTGSHFRFDDLWRRMEAIRLERGDPDVV